MQKSKRDLAINQVPITTKPDVQINCRINTWLLVVTSELKKSRPISRRRHCYGWGHAQRI